MCTYVTETIAIEGSAKGPGGSWFAATRAAVYVDHPVHARFEHTVNIDVADPTAGPGERVALELSVGSARALVRAIESVLAALPEELAGALS